MVIAYEYESIVNRVFRDYKFAAKILRIPRQHIEFYSSKNGETWIKVKNKWGVNKIWFEHGKAGSEGFKGFRPSTGNKWLYVRFYELTNFINWNSRELSNTIATFIRDAYSNVIWWKVEKYCREHGIYFKKEMDWLLDQDWYLEKWQDFSTHEFCVEYEFNTPGTTKSQGGWVMDWLANKRKANNVYYQFNNYMDMTPKEKYKFLKGETLVEIENMKLNDPINYNHLYLGKMPYDGDVCFPNMDYRVHFGKHENFVPDILIIGVDVGRNDPTVCTLNGFEYRGKDLRMQLGIHRWSHCNRKMEYIKDGVKLPYKSWDINEYATMILQFCDMVHEEYPHTMIYFQMDREGAGKDFYDACFRYKDPTFLIINRLWKKQSNARRVDAMWTAFSIPGIVKISDPVLYSAYKNQVWDTRKDREDGEHKRLDDPSKPSLDMDSQDSCEYGFLYEFFDMFTQRIRKNKGKFNGPFSPNRKVNIY